MNIKNILNIIDKLYKVVMYTYKAIHNITSSYLNCLINASNPIRTTRSSIKMMPLKTYIFNGYYYSGVVYQYDIYFILCIICMIRFNE